MHTSLRVLHLEDNPMDVLIVRKALSRSGLSCDIEVAQNGDEFRAALARGGFDLILSDSSLPQFSGSQAQQLAQQHRPGTPFIFVCGYAPGECPDDLRRAAGENYVSKASLDQLGPSVRRALAASGRLPQPAPSAAAPPQAPLRDQSLSPPAPAVAPQGVEPWRKHRAATERLVAAVQELSLARDLPTVMAIVRRAARELTEADGASFVLRDGDLCFYAEENAIGPLWKGRRFPMSACVSGWTMLNRQAAVIPDVFADPRVPADAYRPTFVRSLAMVPIRTAAPVGAIGNYWAAPHQATADEVQLLQALADSTSIALENVQVYSELEARVRQRTAELQIANQELEAFSYSVSHDLRAPLRAIDSFSQFMAEECSASLDANGREYLAHIRSAADRMGQLIEDLLKLSRVSRAEVVREPVDLSRMAREVLEPLQAAAPGRCVECRIAEGVVCRGDPRLLRVVLENLLSNAWKYSSKNPQAVVEFGALTAADGTPCCYVRDNGAGFDMQQAARLFTPFQRLHTESEFPGTGVGLATVQRVVQKHGGRIWAESRVGQGATFYFTVPDAASAPTGVAHAG